MRVSNKHKIQIEYETNSNSPALYWLKPDQTSNGTHPLLISNSKLTCTKAIFPCQDTPSRKITFDSEISVGFNAMMPGFSKREIYENNRVIYIFSVTPNIPSYAMYIIVGSLKEVKILGRCAHVGCNLWTEKKYLHQNIMAVNKIMDILYIINEHLHRISGTVNLIPFNICVLPPNMPEFDMQCPCVTFVSSTVLEDHYSMINTIVQNIIESWIKRIVTIANFQHLWLIYSYLYNKCGKLRSAITRTSVQFSTRTCYTPYFILQSAWKVAHYCARVICATDGRFHTRVKTVR
ncbi:leukotriene A-4 hydrolase-like [Temnothorax longispinosus]|uniref:leukotriene A-4 hydrolase-like n=1 Tax=Temnothorax longispinosus TaxID=300112 RepID=UPI003A99DE59